VAIRVVPLAERANDSDDIHVGSDDLQFGTFGRRLAHEASLSLEPVLDQQGLQLRRADAGDPIPPTRTLGGRGPGRQPTPGDQRLAGAGRGPCDIALAVSDGDACRNEPRRELRELALEKGAEANSLQLVVAPVG